MPPGRGSALGRKFLALPYYSESVVFASPLSAFSFLYRVHFTVSKISSGSAETVTALGGNGTTTRCHNESGMLLPEIIRIR